MNTEPSILAIHEGGHYIAARLLGLGPISLTLEPDGDARGHVLFGNKLTNDYITARQFVVVYLAGAAAEKIHLGLAEAAPAGTDESQARELARRIVGYMADEATLQRELASCARAAESILRDNWGWVLKAASAAQAFQNVVNEFDRFARGVAAPTAAPIITAPLAATAASPE